ncbi:MAG: extracellular solute-binding protein [Sporolactobacillus sp.]|jgi:raffinose/stachyose/melibiose transport system substrate-binding protein|nr:extracellular solute-binding protein [Sporolactobacillus sp.]
MIKAHNKNRLFKIIIVSFLSFLMVFSLAACSNGNASHKSRTIKIIGFYDHEMKPVLKAVRKNLHGKYKIEYTYVPLSQFNNVVNTQLASGSGPDILLVGSSFPALIRSKYVADISNEKYLNNFNSAGFTLAKDKNDKIYGVPTYGWFSGIWYNKDIFAKYHLKVPSTFKDYLSVCKKLKSAGITPLAFGLSDGDIGLHAWLGYLQNSYYMDSSSNVQNDQKFAYGKAKLSHYLLKGTEQWDQIIKDGYMSKEMVGLSASQALNKFMTGKSAMYLSGPWDYANLKKSKINFAMFPYPGTHAQTHYLLGGPAATVGMNRKTKNRAGSEAVLKAFATKDVQDAWVKVNPGSFSYYKGMKASLPKEYNLVKSTLNSGRVTVAWDRWGVNMPAETLLTTIKKNIQSLASQSITVKQFLQNIDEKADQIRYK